MNILKINNLYGGFVFLMASFLMVGHKYKEAIEILSNSLKYEKYFSQKILSLIYEQLGKCYFDTGTKDKAEIYLLKALEMDTKQERKNSEISSRLGFIYFEQSNFEKAKYFLEKAKENYKKFHYADIERVKFYLQEIERINS